MCCECERRGGGMGGRGWEWRRRDGCRCRQAGTIWGRGQMGGGWDRNRPFMQKEDGAEWSDVENGARRGRESTPPTSFVRWDAGRASASTDVLDHVPHRERGAEGEGRGRERGGCEEKERRENKTLTLLNSAPSRPSCFSICAASSRCLRAACTVAMLEATIAALEGRRRAASGGRREARVYRPRPTSHGSDSNGAHPRPATNVQAAPPGARHWNAAALTCTRGRTTLPRGYKRRAATRPPRARARGTTRRATAGARGRPPLAHTSILAGNGRGRRHGTEDGREDIHERVERRRGGPVLDACTTEARSPSAPKKENRNTTRGERTKNRPLSDSRRMRSTALCVARRSAVFARRAVLRFGGAVAGAAFVAPVVVVVAGAVVEVEAVVVVSEVRVEVLGDEAVAVLSLGDATADMVPMLVSSGGQKKKEKKSGGGSQGDGQEPVSGWVVEKVVGADTDRDCSAGVGGCRRVVVEGVCYAAG
ncbi:hypothetical protein B0H10DRAFT_1950072 [Mycena sp. CBHHK59/15]|nr:hypothetical protein B0H10DRAFT_1950072 [Mycena sp. CBHHK59/15]